MNKIDQKGFRASQGTAQTKARALSKKRQDGGHRHHPGAVATTPLAASTRCAVARAAIVMRIILTLFAVALLTLPWLKIIGSLLLFWIGVKLLVPEEDDAEIEASDQLLSAIKTILIADLVMSLDNVIAVAAAAGGSVLLLILGLAISIPLVIFGATLLLKLMERFPVIITICGALIGWC